MARVIYKIDKLNDEQVKLLYAMAEKMKVGICLWQNTPPPTRAASNWAIDGGIIRIFKFTRLVRKLTGR